MLLSLPKVCDRCVMNEYELSRTLLMFYFILFLTLLFMRRKHLRDFLGLPAVLGRWTFLGV